MEWEERDAASISLFKHCIAGKYRIRLQRNDTILILIMTRFNSINENKLTFYFYLGSCAGIMEHLSLYPVDTLKVSIPIFNIIIFFYRLIFNHHLIH